MNDGSIGLGQNFNYSVPRLSTLFFKVILVPSGPSDAVNYGRLTKGMWEHLKQSTGGVSGHIRHSIWSMPNFSVQTSNAVVP